MKEENYAKTIMITNNGLLSLKKEILVHYNGKQKKKKTKRLLTA